MSYTDHRLHHYLCFDIACACIREKIAHVLSTLWQKAKPRTLDMNGIGLSQEPFYLTIACSFGPIPVT